MPEKAKASVKRMNSTISTKSITYVILFWDVDFKSHAQFKSFHEKRLCATTTNLMWLKWSDSPQKSNIFGFCLKILCSLLGVFKSFESFIVFFGKIILFKSAI